MTENHGVPVRDQPSYNFLFSMQNPRDLDDTATEGLAATLAATEATLYGIRRTIIAVRVLDFAVFAGHTGIRRYVAESML